MGLSCLQSWGLPHLRDLTKNSYYSELDQYSASNSNTRCTARVETCMLTHGRLETHAFAINIVATAALVLKHQAISDQSADYYYEFCCIGPVLHQMFNSHCKKWETEIII